MVRLSEIFLNIPCDIDHCLLADIPCFIYLGNALFMALLGCDFILSRKRLSCFYVMLVGCKHIFYLLATMNLCK